MANWETIRGYARATWSPKAIDMDAIKVTSYQGDSGFDGGLAGHNLTGQCVDANGIVWTATSVGNGSSVVITLSSANGTDPQAEVEVPQTPPTDALG